MMLNIDKQTYKVKKENYYKVKESKTQIIIANSMRKNNFHTVHMQHKEHGESKKWNTFTISREGVIYQHYDPKYYTDFLGIKKADKKSISIVLENMGGLYKNNENKYINWLNEECNEGLVVRKNFLGQMYWEEYGSDQIRNMINLCKHLTDEFDIRKKVIEIHFYYKKAIEYNGILIKGNYFEDDPNTNPTLDLIKFNKLLNN